MSYQCAGEASRRAAVENFHPPLCMVKYALQATPCDTEIMMNCRHGPDKTAQKHNAAADS